MLGNSPVVSLANPLSGGLYDHGYDRNKFAKRFNAKTVELNGSSRPKVIRRRVYSLPFLMGL